jgi:hypothetical protein
LDHCPFPADDAGGRNQPSDCAKQVKASEATTRRDDDLTDLYLCQPRHFHLPSSRCGGWGWRRNKSRHHLKNRCMK